MTGFHEIVRKIKGKENTGEQLVLFQQGVKKDAGRLSECDLALQLVAFYESLLQEEADYLLLGELRDAVSSYLQGVLKLQDAVLLRQKNSRLMQTVSRTIDSYQLAEYLLNRAEHRFIGEKSLPEDYADLSFTEEIMSFISMKKDEARGLALADILAELPVRMTKERFYETVSNRLGIYRSSDTEALEGILSQIYPAAGLTDEEEAGRYAPLSEVREILEFFSSCSLSDIEEADFFRLQDRLGAISRRLNLDSDLCHAAALVLNDLETLLLSGGGDTEAPEYRNAKSIQEKTASLLLKLPERDEALLEEVLSECENLEGHLEDALEAFRESSSFIGEVLDRCSEEIASAGLEDAYGALQMIRALRSDSIFAEEPGSVRPPEDVTDAVFEEECGKLLASFAKVFGASKKSYSRAVMARVLSILPPVFKSAEELENYIFAALSSCRRAEEKLACIELVRSIMEQ